ncbi:hypothetical protein GCM10009836_15760 [Pseudonocardia ailaonensis]|uniref:Uncharacterized protein n=1 Tax=Pseudonocardia ailaonensis TaxID=367279 RepID=A0ABN2MWD5_9PSEU
MTTLASTPVRPVIGRLAAAGTLPYVAIKSAWLTGHPIGVPDPGMLEGTSMTVLNAVTVLLDACVVALALALTHPWGRRLPVVALLLPAWVGTGLLLPVGISFVPALWLAFGGGPVGGLDGWVRPLVYGGFAWQAVFLVIALWTHVRDRWELRGAVPAGFGPLARALAGGGTVLALVSAVLQLGSGISGGGAQILVGTVNAALAVAGAVGVVTLLRGGGRAAAVAAWLGSGAMFSWGLYTTALTMGGTVMAAGTTPASGLAALTGLLAGFALAPAGLLALTPPTP